MKRIIALFLFTFFCFGLVACDLTSKNNTTEPTKENTVVEPGDKTNENSGYDFETVFNKVKALIPSEGVKDNINLPSAVGSVAFVWSSSDETVCTKNGVVTRGLEDKEVTLTALMIYGKEQATMSFTVTVLKTEETLNTISEVLNADMNSVPLPSFSVCGDVIALGGSSFLIKDETDRKS